LKKDIKYLWGADHLLIDLGNRVEPRIKILFFAEFLVTSGMATIFLLQSLPLSGNAGHWIACIGSATLYFLASWRFLSRVFFKEKILIDKQDITIIRLGFLHRQVRHYGWRHIGPLHYAGKEVKTDHPLKGRSFDYFGFETQEHLIQSLHHNGNLYFNFGDHPVRFARGVYSWDAEEMVRMMQLYAGNTLRLGPEWQQIMQEQEEL
jgi:hypothetical protein